VSSPTHSEASGKAREYKGMDPHRFAPSRISLAALALALALAFAGSLTESTQTMAKNHLFLKQPGPGQLPPTPRLIALESYPSLPLGASITAKASRSRWSLFRQTNRAPASINIARPMHETDPARRLLPYGPADLRPILFW
jgi:hypothetical protein